MTLSLWPSKFCSHFIEFIFHIFIVLSKLPDANKFAVNRHKHLTEFLCSVNELIKENYNLKNKKLITDEDFSLNGIKSDYSFVKNKLNEYKNLIINYNNQINLEPQSNIFDKGMKLLNDNFEKIINNKFNDLFEYKEKATKFKSELDTVNFEINVPDNYDISKTTTNGVETAILVPCTNYQNMTTNMIDFLRKILFLKS